MNGRVFFIVVVLLMIFLSGCGVKKMNTMSIQGWMFPSDKTCDATQDIINNKIDVLKPQYYTLQDDGTLKLLTSALAPCNAWSVDDVALVKKHSSQQYVTISGDTTGMDALATSSSLKSAFLSTLYSFLDTSGFTGVELDFEGFGNWTPQQYTDYKALVTIVGNALHARKSKLMIDGPAISDATYQGYYQFKYEEMNALPIDAIVAMAYDYNFDQGAGSPIAPLSWISNICQWMLSKITDHSKIIIGLNNYGYHESAGVYNKVIEDTYQQSMQFPGFSTATRDKASGEMTWTNAGIFYNYSDQTTLQGKVNAVLQSGIQAISVWHLGGGGAWINQTPQPAPKPTIAVTSDQIKAIYDVLTPDQIAAIKSIIH